VREHVDEHRELALLLESVLGQRGYLRALARNAAEMARSAQEPWPVRRAATLLLEHLLLRTADVSEWRWWMRELRIDDLDVTQLRTRMSRLARVHESLTTDAAIGDFFHIAARDCRLTLARYVFGAKEVIARVDRELRHSRGIRSKPDYGHRLVEEESAHILRKLPPLERKLIDHLGRDAAIRFITERTNDDINTLVEHPVGTVVAVIKPPGSDLEIEIKRAGMRAPLPFDVMYARNGYIVPNSHFLQGGSMEHLLAFEASQASVLSRIYRSVHGVDAAMSRTIHLATVFTIPTPDGEADVLDYFTEPSLFGERYKGMRARMEDCVAELASQQKKDREPPINDLSLTVEFLGQVKPAQAVQIGTTSFRLERLAAYLAPNGDTRFFNRDRGIDFTPAAARRFADELLDEILCVYEPPRVPYRSYASYLDAAYAVRANRRRANANYLDAMTQFGRMWGTLLGARGHSEGESFVSRNTGLRSVFEDGEWRIQMVFMDHDSLSFSSRHRNAYHPAGSVRCAAKDARFIFGGYSGKRYVRGSVDYLREIYRVNQATERRGMTAMRAEMKRAYDATQAAMRRDDAVRELFHVAFIDKLGDWDEVVASYMRTKRTTSARNAWKFDTSAMLLERGYSEELAAEYLATVLRFARFLRRIAFLF